MLRMLLALIAIVGIAVAADAPFRLSQLQWKHRVLLVFAPTAETPAFRRQMEEWKDAAGEMADRDLLLIPLVAGRSSMAAGREIRVEDQTRLRRELGVAADTLTVIVVGRDGGVKLRQTGPVTRETVFALIDSMPMRREEMRSQEGSWKD